MKEFNMLAKTYFGLEDILARELTELGANEIETDRRAVRFKGDKALLYKANLNLRSAIRILVPIAQFKATDADEVYEKAKKINWEEYFGIKQNFIINETIKSDNFRHSKFVAYRLKDAIADYFTEKYDKRPSEASHHRTSISTYTSLMMNVPSRWTHQGRVYTSAAIGAIKTKHQSQRHKRQECYSWRDGMAAKILSTLCAVPVHS